MSEPSKAARLLVVPPGEGLTSLAFGSAATVKIDGAQTGGSLCVLFAETPPGAGPPLHVHARDDELFVVLEGELSFFGPSGWVRAPRGSVVFAPRGIAHTFRNSGATVSRHVVVASPSGFEEFYRRAAELFAAGGPPDAAALQRLSAEYGYTIMGPAPEGAP